MCVWFNNPEFTANVRDCSSVHVNGGKGQSGGTPGIGELSLVINIITATTQGSREAGGSGRRLFGHKMQV